MVTLLILLVGLPISLYLAMSLPIVQEELRQTGQKELSALLGVDVHIDQVQITPFSNVELSGITVSDIYGDTALTIDRLGAGLSMRRLIFNQRLVINYVELIGPSVNIYRPSPDRPLNIDPIIQALKPKNSNKAPAKFDLQANMVVIRRGSISLDADSVPDSIPNGIFDKNHIRIYDLKADIGLPRLKNNDFIINLKRLSLKEQSGLNLTDLHVRAIISDSEFSIEDFQLSMPSSCVKLGDIKMGLGSIADLEQKLKTASHHIIILPQSHIFPPDLSPVVSQLANLPIDINIFSDISGTIDEFYVNRLNISTDNGFTYIDCSGQIDSLLSPTGRTIDISQANIRTQGLKLDSIVSAFIRIPSDISSAIDNLGQLNLNSQIYISDNVQRFTGHLHTAPGNIDIELNTTRYSRNMPLSITGMLRSESLDVKQILPSNKIGRIAFDVKAEGNLNRKQRSAYINVAIPQIEWQGNTYSSITANLEHIRDSFICSLDIDDPSIIMQADGTAVLGKNQNFELCTNIHKVTSSVIGIDDKYPGYTISGKINATFSGSEIDYADGRVTISDLHFHNNNGEGLSLSPIDIDIHNSTLPQHIVLSSGPVNGSMQGSYSYSTIANSIKDIYGSVFPALISEDRLIGQDTNRHPADSTIRQDNFSYHINITDNQQISSFFKLPVRILYPMTISGQLNHENNYMEVTVDAPYLQQKDKLIRNTHLYLNINGDNDEARLAASTLVPSKYGDVSLHLGCFGASDRLDSKLTWLINNKRAFNGNIDISALMSRDVKDNLLGHITINPSQMVFNDTVWSISRSEIYALPQRISVENFNIQREGQSLAVNGVASADSVDSITIKLANIDLDYVFGTLHIDNVMFGGIATGNFYGRSLLSKEPVLYTPKLYVKNLKYNNAVMGDTEIVSAWHNDTKGISIDAVVKQSNGLQSEINGTIYPLTEELDFRFKADKVAVGFMQPFMSAFADQVSGYASGNAHLYGTFKYLDMTGDLYADDFSIKLGFTNTTYWASDSIRLRPGSIQIDNLRIKDKCGNTALLNGWVSHKFFKEPSFDFSLTRAENFLSYDAPQSTEYQWYGKIFGNGSAFINGSPGVVNIGVDMATAPGSTFTFVLSDAEVAEEYSFITFRDRNAKVITDTTGLKVGSAELDRLMYEKVRKNQAMQSSSAYNMNFQVDVTPAAEIILVMDPVGGDRITSHGAGRINMQYESLNDVLKMYGTYTLNRGNYNFTLQDIIIKNFTIRNGSSIEFHGDPYSALLNINATYSLNANLSDLDESFLTDKDLNRTNVPVYAVLKVTGDMRVPDISFDLEFPTLTSDTYRKVRSIVSTDEMMNRQIIYLLALNRFYTPDYMASTTKGNELMSVASSTISSQLSSILGQLSDNWSVAPTVRTDRGDFSNVEVDVALSSTLLNNRLLFNGNFGYRDKAYNDNSFIGDFDIEYLLNRSGNIRLKAYNRYNDQNYYVKTALTTQGIGVVFKRDFDNVFSFLKPIKEYFRKEQSRLPRTLDADSTITTITDTVILDADSTMVIPERKMP